MSKLTKLELGYMWARKMKKVQAKKLVKSNKSKIFFVKLHFWQFWTFFQFKNWFLAIFEIAKKWILVQKNLWYWFIWFLEFFWPGHFNFILNYDYLLIFFQVYNSEKDKWFQCWRWRFILCDPRIYSKLPGRNFKKRTRFHVKRRVYFEIFHHTMGWISAECSNSGWIV